MITSVCDVTRDAGAPGVGDKVIRGTEELSLTSLTSSLVLEVRVRVSVALVNPEYRDDDGDDSDTVRLGWTSLR